MRVRVRISPPSSTMRAAMRSTTAGRAVAADVGVRLPGDVPRGPRLHEALDDPGDGGGVRAGGELSVGEGAGAAHAELDVCTPGRACRSARTRAQAPRAGARRRRAPPPAARTPPGRARGRRTGRRSPRPPRRAASGRRGPRRPRTGSSSARGSQGTTSRVRLRCTTSRSSISGERPTRTVATKWTFPLAAGVDGAAGELAGRDIAGLAAQLAGHGRAQALGVIPAAGDRAGQGQGQVADLDHASSPLGTEGLAAARPAVMPLHHAHARL